MKTVEPEIVETGKVHAHWQGRPLGRGFGVLVGLLGGLTFLTAVAVGLAGVFAWSLVWATAIWLLWPMVFAPTMTTWMFGTAEPAWWKIFVIVGIAQLILKTNHRGRTGE